MKYATEIDFSYDNTMSILADRIREASIVLEFGPASGRLTKYLKEKKHCKVYIVEIDEAAGKIAAQFAEDAVIGDILDYEWVKRFADIRFDYIIFADVLEHIQRQEDVLRECQKLLAAQGKIMVSVPNIAHNSVIIDLLKNRFRYTNTGLLDSTHLKFWTEESLDQLFESVHLHVDEKLATYTQVGFNEFQNQYTDLKNILPYALKARPYGEVYQYIYIASEDFSTQTLDKIQRVNDYYYVQGFEDVDGNTEHLIEHKVILDLQKEVQEVSFTLQSGTHKFRWDPINCSCALRLERIWGVSEGKEIDVEIESTNAEWSEDNIYYFVSEDPMFYVRIEGKSIQELRFRWKFCSIEDHKLDTLFQKMKEAVKNREDVIFQKENYINEQRERLEEQRIITEQKENYINEQRAIIEQKENYINEQRAIIEQKENYINEQRHTIDDYSVFVNRRLPGVLYKMYCKEKTKYEKSSGI